MPGKCKFQDIWLLKSKYKGWLAKDEQDISLARCTACLKSVKLQSMGEAALTSHAGGAGHKAAVMKLEGNNAACQMNSTMVQTEYSEAMTYRSPDSDLGHSPTKNPTVHNAQLQEVTFFAVIPDTSSVTSPDGPPRPPTQHRATELLKVEQSGRDALEREVKIPDQTELLWELQKEKLRVARQKRKTSEAKEAYYIAKLKKMGEEGSTREERL